VAPHAVEGVDTTKIRHRDHVQAFQLRPLAKAQILIDFRNIFRLRVMLLLRLLSYYCPIGQMKQPAWS